jgi:hypothetical protein
MKKILFCLFFLILLIGIPSPGVAETQTTDLWYPYAEWSFGNIQYSGNAFDIDAIASFSDGKDVGLFYDGEQTWKLRYMCTQPGTFKFIVSSANASLNDLSGEIVCSDTVGEPGPLVPGGLNQSLFYDPALGQPIIPAWAMMPDLLGEKPSDSALNDWMDNHIGSVGSDSGAKFRGAHFDGPANGWYDHTCNGTRSDCERSANPDPETFRSYEALFAKLAERNAFAHFWMFWDCQRDKCDQFHDGPAESWKTRLKSMFRKDSGGDSREGIRRRQLRLRKYMARRWGAISNWMVGEGFDNFEDDTAEYANQWFRDLNDHMPWFHFIGMRGYKNRLDRVICTECNYVSFESQEEEGPMTYERWRASRNAAADRPVFEEDRYRYIRNHHKGPRDYEGQLMYLWGQAMNLGVGAIYGYLEGAAGHFSRYEGYPEDWERGIRAWHDFWYVTSTDPFHRFLSGMQYCNELSVDSKGICLPGIAYVFYRDDGNRIQFDISGLTASSAPAVALNAKTGEFLDLGAFPKTMTRWTAPVKSSWALAIGTFPGKADGDGIGR